MITKFKLFENDSEQFNYDVDFTVGDYVYVKRSDFTKISGHLKYDTKYKIVKIYSASFERKQHSTNPEDFCDLEEKGEIYNCFWLKRLISEVEYNANKYNL